MCFADSSRSTQYQSVCVANLTPDLSLSTWPSWKALWAAKTSPDASLLDLFSFLGLALIFFVLYLLSHLRHNAHSSRLTLKRIQTSQTNPASFCIFLSFQVIKLALAWVVVMEMHPSFLPHISPSALPSNLSGLDKEKRSGFALCVFFFWGRGFSGKCFDAI